jgi:tetratricopeptide (TPR) repeat protein/predicted Ser/Thr protein kinase
LSEQDVTSKTSLTQETLLFRGDAPVEQGEKLSGTPVSPTGELVRVGQLTLEAGQALFDDWPRYTFHGVLGKGGAGLVFRVFDEMLRRVVALKFLQRCDARRLERLLWEAQAQARADHPNICKVYEVGTFQGYPYISMQYIKGETLEKASVKMSLLQKVAVFRALADALHAAHRQGLLHRDIKPSNILVREEEGGRWQPYILDFGIAHEFNQAGAKEGASLVGTPLYMSPEQIAGDAVHLDRPTDVYGLGVTFYECLVGQPPFRGEGRALFEKILQEKPPSLARLGIPRDLAAIVHKCLAKHPSARYASMADLAADLACFEEGSPVTARTGLFYRWRRQIYRHRWVVSVAVLVVFVLSAGLFQAWQRRMERFRAAQERQREQQAAHLRAQQVRYWTLSFQERTQKIASLMRLSAMLPLHDTTPERNKALRLLEALERDTKKTDDILRGYAHHRVGMAYLRLGQRKEARKHLRLAWSMGEKSAGPMLALLGWESQWIKTTQIGKRLKGSKPPRYLRYLSHLQQGKEAQKGGYDPAEIAVLESMRLLGKDQWSRALEVLQKGFVEYPWMYELLRLQAHIHWSRVVWQLRRVRSVQKQDSETALRQAEQHYRLAVGLLRRALQIAPSEAGLYESLCFAYAVYTRITEGSAQADQSVIGKGIESCEHALTARPDTRLAHLLLSLLYSARGRQAFEQQKPNHTWLKRALASSHKALHLYPNDGALLLEIARIHTAFAEEAMWRGGPPSGHCRASAPFYERAFRLDPIVSIEPYLHGMWLCAFHQVRHHRDPRFYLDRGKQLVAESRRIQSTKSGTRLLFPKGYLALFEGLSLYTEGLFEAQQQRSPLPWFSRAFAKLSMVSSGSTDGFEQLVMGFVVMGLLEWSKQASPTQATRWLTLLGKQMVGLRSRSASAPWAYYLEGRAALLVARRIEHDPQRRLKKLQEAESLLSASIRRKTDFFDAHAALLEVSLTTAQTPIPAQKEPVILDEYVGSEDVPLSDGSQRENAGTFPHDKDRAQPRPTASPRRGGEPPAPPVAPEATYKNRTRGQPGRTKHKPKARTVELKGLQSLRTGDAFGYGQQQPPYLDFFRRVIQGVAFIGGKKQKQEQTLSLRQQTHPTQILRLIQRAEKIRSFPHSPQRTRLLAEVERTLQLLLASQQIARNAAASSTARKVVALGTARKFAAPGTAQTVAAPPAATTPAAPRNPRKAVVSLIPRPKSQTPTPPQRPTTQPIRAIRPTSRPLAHPNSRSVRDIRPTSRPVRVHRPTSQTQRRKLIP